MFLLFFSLIQSQQSPRLSPLVIAAAVLAFIVGVGLLVYFFRRLKTSEKEAEEDWSLSRRSLFVSPDPVEQKTAERAAAEPLQSQPLNTAATENLVSIRTGEIHEAQDEPVHQRPPATEELRAEYFPAPKVISEEAPANQGETLPLAQPEPLREERQTQVLASLQPEDLSEETGSSDEPTPFDDEVWAGLEVSKQETATTDRSGEVDQRPELAGSEELWPAIEQPFAEQPPAEQHSAELANERQIQSPVERREARVEYRTGREPFEPPVIKPLTPREQSTFIENRADTSPSQDLYASSPRVEKGSTSEPLIYGTEIERQPPDREFRPETLYEDVARRSDAHVPSSIYPEPADRPMEPSIAAPVVEQARGPKSRSGSILGLPAEASRGPLILGEPVRSKEERGIGALSNYGRPLEKDGGRGGTVVLLVVVMILVGGLLAYFYIPSVKAGVNAWVARVRGTDIEEARRTALIPKAVIYPRFNSEVIKNQVKIKGAVDNIWNEQLENLTVEVSLVRAGDQTPQVINVGVIPNTLPPNQRGTFDFEYDGKRDTGFTGYKITRLLSNGNEVRFTSPQKQ